MIYTHAYYSHIGNWRYLSVYSNNAHISSLFTYRQITSLLWLSSLHRCTHMLFTGNWRHLTLSLMMYAHATYSYTGNLHAVFTLFLLSWCTYCSLFTCRQLTLSLSLLMYGHAHFSCTGNLHCIHPIFLVLMYIHTYYLHPGNESFAEIWRHRKDCVLRGRVTTKRDLCDGSELLAIPGLAQGSRDHEEHHWVLHQRACSRLSGILLRGLRSGRRRGW